MQAVWENGVSSRFRCKEMLDIVFEGSHMSFNAKETLDTLDMAQN